MSCILRVYGEQLDVGALTSAVSLEADRIWKKGEKRRAGAGKLQSSSGVTFVASEADFDCFKVQVRDAIEFLERNLADVSVLSAFPGVERAVLDFGAEMSEGKVAVSSYLPPQLVRLAASAGIGIEVSVYACSGDPGGEG